MAPVELSRRELIASFLGTAVACHRSAGGPPVPGAIVDRAFELGHRLREGPLPVSARPPTKVDVAIVGAGVAGLSAAWRLAAAGVRDFLVLELDDALGGTAQSGKNAVSAFPWGAHYLPAPLEDGGPVVRLLREMGLVTGTRADGRPAYAEEALVAEPEERLFYKGLWSEGLYLRSGATPEDLAELTRFEDAMLAFSRARDAKGRKAFAVPVERSSDDAAWTVLDRSSMADWMDAEGFRSPRLRWFVDYACRDDYGGNAANTSAWAGVWYFAARQDGENRGDGNLTWPEGNGHLVAQLARAAGAGSLRPRILVHTLDPRDGGCRVDAWDAERPTPVSFLARQVIFAGPRFVAPYVVAPWRSERPEFVRGFEYAPWVVANLTLREPPRSRGFPLAWDNVFYESKSLGYVVATHQTPRSTAAGPTVLTWYYPLTGDDPRVERTRALNASYADWAELVFADLAPAHGNLRPSADRLDVVRWGHGMIRPRPGFMWGPHRAAASRPLGALHFAHTDLGGLALFEEANWHGVRAAEEVLAALGTTPPSWL